MNNPNYESRVKEEVKKINNEKLKNVNSEIEKILESIEQLKNSSNNK